MIVRYEKIVRVTYVFINSLTPLHVMKWCRTPLPTTVTHETFVISFDMLTTLVVFVFVCIPFYNHMNHMNKTKRLNALQPAHLFVYQFISTTSCYEVVSYNHRLCLCTIVFNVYEFMKM